MTSRTRRSTPLLVLLVTLATVVGLVALTVPASAHGSKTLSYVALGDSYAAGQGAGRYLNACLQSRRGYPARLDNMRRIKLRHNATCTGATTSDVVTRQLGSLNRGTRLVTVTVGGNDLHVADVAAACLAGPTLPCQAAIAQAVALLAPQPDGSSVLGTRLVSTYATIARAAPNARILVTGYPYLFETPAADDPNAATIVAINQATTALNATIRSAVAGVRALDVNITYVDVTTRFAGHGLGSPKPFINADGPDAFHPTARGYRAYAAAVKAALGSSAGRNP